MHYILKVCKNSLIEGKVPNKECEKDFFTKNTFIDIDRNRNCIETRASVVLLLLRVLGLYVRPKVNLPKVNCIFYDQK